MHPTDPSPARRVEAAGVGACRGAVAFLPSATLARAGGVRVTGEPRFLDAGETALVVEFGTTVDPALHDHVLALDRALAARALPGVRETVPTFRSLMIHYDPLVIARDDLVAQVHSAERTPPPPRRGARWTVPCCYDAGCGEDLGALAAQTGVSAARLVALHAGSDLRVYMYGFLPGFCYLGGVPRALAVSRRAAIRPPHAAGAVIVADGMSVITTFSMPTGWWVIGQTPERLFAPARAPSFLVAVGDIVRFEAIDRATFAALAARVAAGEIVARREPAS
jgi:KipI family sensor histidine kinase inhibitor